MHFSRSGIAKGLNKLATGRATHDRIIDHHNAFAVEHIGKGIELHADAGFAHRLGGLNEGTTDVTVLDQTIGIGQSCGLGVTDRSGDARIWNTDHQISLHRRFPGKDLTDALAIAVQRFTEKPTVRPGEINHLEHAHARGGLNPALPLRGGVPGQEGDDLTGLNVINEGGPDDVEPTGFTAEHPLTTGLLTERAEHQGPDAVSVAQAVERSRSADHQTEGALTERHRRGDRSLPVEPTIHSLLNGKSNQLGIRGGREFHLSVINAFAQLGSVDQIAVVGQRKGSEARHQNHWLGIADPAAASCGITVVANGEIARHPGEHVLIEHLADQAHVFVKTDFALVKDSDACGLLAAVLQGIQTEISQVGHRLLGGLNGKHAAGFLHPIGTLRLELMHGPPRLRISFRILHHAVPSRRGSA